MAKYNSKKIKKKIDELHKLIDNNDADFGEIISISGTEQHEELIEISKILKKIGDEILEKETEYISKGVLDSIPKDFSFSVLKELFNEKNNVNNFSEKEKSNA